MWKVLWSFRGGAEQAFLLVNGEALRLDEFSELMIAGNLHQAWTPVAEGEYVLQVVLNGAAGRVESEEITVVVGPREVAAATATFVTITTLEGEVLEETPTVAAATATGIAPTATEAVSLSATPTESGPSATASFTASPSATEVVEAAISGFVFRDENGNGVFDGGDSALVGVSLRLAGAACPASGLTTTSTNGSGIYFFTGLSAGTYCVRVDQNSLPNIGGTWSPSMATEHTVVVGEGQTVGGQDFSFEPIIN